ncbi:MAG: ferritin-like domain-containing protein [Gemmatimonadales bacterium]
MTNFAPTTRRRFLAAAGTATVLAAVGCSEDNAGPSGGGAVLTLPLQSDTDVLKYALFLELLEADFYNKAVASGVLSGGVAALAADVRTHENVHVATLQDALGAMAFDFADVGFDFGSAFASQASFLATAKVLEETGVAAYLGAIGLIQSKAVRVTAGSIYTIEARHAAAFRAYLNSPGGPVPAAFETGRTPAEIVAAVQATGFVTKGL